MLKILWWLIAGSTGGPNRARIIMALHERPLNAHQLAERLELNYKTVRHHIKVMEENKIVTSSGPSTGKKQYGEIYFLSNLMEENYDTFKDIWSDLK
ncbi:winged helix-turn-helix transcriptional regulator [Methanobacterium sp. CWC-01]|jgi:DNA-binding transcriptional ArsR family regulator|uniref:ArsR/SmtB family transcription factor n=1 Tax=Methanobacterium aridiramus TaxID=2584467 RepID=UPI002577A830|nr:winged helix-turn-helix domain-containing protein [Methanobacterium sp. CWC-01]WJI09005.1 winged helix-turn-helix transcriptional regulator [Methanobacterium sp. CWC-01]